MDHSHLRRTGRPCLHGLMGCKEGGATQCHIPYGLQNSVLIVGNGQSGNVTGVLEMDTPSTEKGGIRNFPLFALAIVCGREVCVAKREGDILPCLRLQSFLALARLSMHLWLDNEII